MIDIDLIRADKAAVAKNLAKRGVRSEDIDMLLELDEAWRVATRKLEEIHKLKNEANTKIAKASDEEKKEIIAQVSAASAEEKKLAAEAKELAEKRETLWRSLPNLIMDDVPEGGEGDFEVLETIPQEIPTPTFTQKSYVELLPDLIDIDRAGKVSGSRFVYLKGKIARLEIGLVSFLLDQLSSHDFTPVMPPVLIGEKAMAGMGYLDRAPEEIYKTQDELYLVGTSEQAIGPMHMDEIFEAAQMPRRYVAFSPCFRREAGSHGKDVKGILRLHQFDKVEMFSFTTPEQSAAEHEFFLEREKEIMAALELPYRVIKLAANDTGAPSAKTYDIETWMPSEGKYRETHSTSNTTDYQARRLNIRVKTKEGKVVKAHMLNGTAVAMSRIFIALIENHQQIDGTISIPKALHPYLPFQRI